MSAPRPEARLSLRELTWSAVCIGLGLAVPVAFHAVGLGATFLPMFLPLPTAGLLLRPLPAGMVGLITPPLSALLTGLPPLLPPVALVMALEGLMLGGLSAVLRRRTDWNLFLIAALAVLAERIIMVLATMALAPLFGLPARLAAVGMLARGLPGVALLVVGVPMLIRRLERILPGARAGNGQRGNHER